MSTWIIAVLEDDYEIMSGIKELLDMNHFQVKTARTVAEFQNMETADLYLLDVILPDGDGFQVCRQIRQNSDAPVIFITSCDDQESVVKGLDIGGDDYITKPFYTGELLSTIQANLRRIEKTRMMEDEQSKSINVYEKGELTVDLSQHKVFRNEQEISLTSTEFELMRILISNKGMLMKREVLLQKIWDNSGNFVENNTLNVVMSRLKSKLGTYGMEGQSTSRINPQADRWSMKCFI